MPETLQHSDAPVTRPAAPAGGEPLARVRGLSVRYGDRPVLEDLRLDVRAREIVALIGPNGSGKSTLLRAVAGFLRPAAGEILFGGRDVTRLAPHERARLGMGYLMQGGRIFYSLTVDENLELAAARLRKAERARNTEMVQHLFPHLIGQSRVRAALLSGGERQALALAVILVARPRLLLLDEPSAGLAPAVTRRLMDSLGKIVSEWGVSILLVEQNIGEAVAVATRVVALARRTATEMSGETPESLLNSSRLEEIFFGRKFS